MRIIDCGDNGASKKRVRRRLFWPKSRTPVFGATILDSHPFFSNRKALFVLATLCCVLWGSSFPAIKAGYALFEIVPGDIASKFVFAGWRFTLAGLALVAYTAASGKVSIRIDRRTLGEVALLGVLQTSVMYTFFYLGLAYTTGVKGSVLNGSVTFFGVLLAHFLYRNDRLSWRKSAGCIVGFAGVLVVNFGKDLLDFSFTWIGEGSVILAAFLMAVGMVYGKNISRRMDAALMTGYQLAIGGAVLLVAGYALGGGLAALTVNSALLMTYMIFNSSAAQALWGVLLKYNRVTMVSIFNFLVPIFGALLSALFLGESVFEWKNVLALILVCSGIWLVTKE